MEYASLFSFCPHCSTKLTDFMHADVLRRRCPRCDWIQFRNPTVGVAVVLMQQKQLLLGRRRDGGWCIPCGHVEWDESVETAAIREFSEETGLHVSLKGIVAVKSNFHDPERQTIGVWYWGRWESGELRPGADLLELDFFDLAALPPLKFPTDTRVVELLSRSSPHS